MGVLGAGIGLVISQLGNVVQSSVGDDDRSEAGGLQNTAQQLGSSMGTALLGAIVITGLHPRLRRPTSENDARIRHERVVAGPRRRRPGLIRLRRTGPGRRPQEPASTPRRPRLISDYEPGAAASP